MTKIIEFEQGLYGSGLARRTVREYVKWVRRLQRWCAARGLDTDQVEAHHVREWIDSTVPPGRESRKQAYTALKHFYAHRVDEPWAAIRVPRKPRNDPHPLTLDEVKQLRDAALMIGGRKGCAALGLMYSAPRPSEIAVWRWDGIDDDGGPRVRFWRTKTSDWHTVPLKPVLAAALETYRPPWAEGFVFPGNNGRAHVTAATIWQWTRDVADVAGLTGVNPKRLRTTWACHTLDATGDVDAVANVLGHTSTDTTRRYYVLASQRRMRSTIDATPY